MKTIYVNPEDLKNELMSCDSRVFGSSDWAIYCDENGKLETCHNTENNIPEYTVVDFYYTDADYIFGATSDELGEMDDKERSECIEDFVNNAKTEIFSDDYEYSVLLKRN